MEVKTSSSIAEKLHLQIEGIGKWRSEAVIFALSARAVIQQELIHGFDFAGEAFHHMLE